MKIFSIFLILIIAAVLLKNLLFSFRSQDPADYSNTGPTFSLKENLAGHILSEGLIYGPNGKMTNGFVANMYGEWKGNTGTLSEDFKYSNGKQQTRKWFLKIIDEKNFTATAADIVGEAKGTISGSTIRMEYKITLPKDAGGYTLSAIDWLYLMENGSIMNKSEMRLFGFKVAELVATMRPEKSVK